jgi:flagellin
MPLRITSNLDSLNAQLNIGRNQTGLTQSLARLSSGFRINSAADDAAGLAISDKMQANIRAMTQASRNASDGISLVQTASGGMDEINNDLTRMKELAEQAATGTVGDTERGYLSSEYVALRDEITRIADSTKFNDTSLLDGTLSVNIQIGISNGTNDTLAIAVSDVGAAALSLTSSIGSVGSAQSALSSVSAAIETLAGRQAGLGALQNRLSSVVANINTETQNLTAANSQIRDVDIAAETANLTKYSILVQAGVSVLAQANQTPSMALTLLK